MAFIWNWWFNTTPPPPQPTSISRSSSTDSNDWVLVKGPSSTPSSGSNSPRNSTFFELILGTQSINREPERLHEVEQIMTTEELEHYGQTIVVQTQGQEPSKLIKMASLVAFVVTTIFFAFIVLYAAGVFHFETFIGPIGTGVSITLSGILVILSGITLISTHCRRS